MTRANLDCGLCSLASKRAGEDPIGSAGQFGQYLLVELPPPWPRNILEARQVPPGLKDVIGGALNAGLKFRPLFVQPDEAETREDGLTRVLHFVAPLRPWAQLNKREFVLPTQHVTALAAALLRGEDLSAFAAFERDTRHIRELLTCTHGRVDAACAKFGHPVYKRLRDEFVPASQGSLRAWRTNHFGGHRFAATLIDLPSGHWWAHLEGEALAQVALRQGNVRELRRHQRGWSALDFWGQLAERAAFEREGWAWLACARWSETLRVEGDAGEDGPGFTTTPPGRAEVRLHFTRAGGERGTYAATIEYQDFVSTQSESGQAAFKRANRYQVTRLELS